MSRAARTIPAPLPVVRFLAGMVACATFALILLMALFTSATMRSAAFGSGAIIPVIFIFTMSSATWLLLRFGGRSAS